jgi:ABC-2 type transport system ATP-binding protein
MEETTGESALELSRLAKTYGRGTAARRAVRSTSLSVPWGQVLGLLGPNGAGKTTLIKMICGLVTPTTGTIRIGGWDLATERSRAVLQIGAVLEGSRNVYWPLSAWENLLYFGRLKGVRGEVLRPRAERLLRDLDLWERRHGQVGSFSRGMQQKVAVAAALITDPPILLLDEPTIGLDVESARTFKEWIAHLARDEHKTILLTTHQLHDVAQELSDRIAVIRSGEIIADLPTCRPMSCSGSTPRTAGRFGSPSLSTGWSTRCHATLRYPRSTARPGCCCPTTLPPCTAHWTACARWTLT